MRRLTCPMWNDEKKLWHWALSTVISSSTAGIALSRWMSRTGTSNVNSSSGGGVRVGVELRVSEAVVGVVGVMMHVLVLSRLALVQPVYRGRTCVAGYLVHRPQRRRAERLRSMHSLPVAQQQHHRRGLQLQPSRPTRVAAL
mmetsp:Transcript_22030/g.49880  ORF Transcript_22030/g.49880 Transcript_22030/m.49880 type:complete len:142 (+) Transcript_22030:500-925(+)